MKVFVVKAWMLYEGSTVVGVYSSMELAKEAVEDVARGCYVDWCPMPRADHPAAFELDLRGRVKALASSVPQDEEWWPGWDFASVTEVELDKLY